MKLMMIISGGQTGADQGGLMAGRRLGLATGGYAPLGWWTEVGPREQLLKEFGLTEWQVPGYAARTRANAEFADVTLWFGTTHSPGYRCTRAACQVLRRDFVVNPTLLVIQSLAKRYGIFNIAGNRESTNRGIAADVESTLISALKPLVDARLFALSSGIV